MRKCLCDQTEQIECHEICIHAGHVGGTCDECEQDKTPDLNWWGELGEGYDYEWDG